MTKRQMKTLARETVARVESTIRDTLAYIATETERLEDVLASYRVAVCVALSEGADAQTTLGKDWREWARAQCAGENVKTVYRWKNAGAVARVLRGAQDENGDYPEDLLASVPATRVGALAVLYRIISKGKTAEEISTAHTLLRETFSEILAECDEDEDEDGNPFRVAPSETVTLAAAERVAPSNRSGGTSETASAADEDEDEDEGEDEDEDGDSRRESGDTLTTASAAAVESATGPTSAILAQCVREHGVSETVAKGIMLAALRLAGEHGVSTIVAVLASAPAAAETGTEDGESK